MILSLYGSTSTPFQNLSTTTPLLFGNQLLDCVVLACLLPSARSRWGFRSRQLMVDGGGDWGKGLFVKGELALGSSTGVGLGEAVMAQGGSG